MELDLPKAQGKEAGKGRKAFNMNNHKFSWKNKCRGREKKPTTTKQQLRNRQNQKKKSTPKYTDQPKGKPWKSETEVNNLSQNFLTKGSLSI